MDYFEKEYIKQKYNEDNLVDKDGSKLDIGWFNPYIYTNEGYIPFCQSCKEDFEKFKIAEKNNEIIEDGKFKWSHPKACLWYDYYTRKIRELYPSIKIIRISERDAEKYKEKNRK